MPGPQSAPRPARPRCSPPAGRAAKKSMRRARRGAAAEPGVEHHAHARKAFAGSVQVRGSGEGVERFEARGPAVAGELAAHDTRIGDPVELDRAPLTDMRVMTVKGSGAAAERHHR